MFDFSDESAEELETGYASNEGAGSGQPTMPEPGATMPGPGPAPGPTMPMPGATTHMTMPASGGGDAALRRGAATTLMGVTAFMLLGGWVAGPRGAAAGVSLYGTFRNANRARKTFTDPSSEVRAEAGKSATMALFGAGIAGMLIYHEWKARNE